MCHVPFLHLACMPIGQYYYCSEDVYHATHLSSCLQTQFYHNLNSLGCISMTLKHVYQGQLPCLELEYRGRAGKKKRPLSVNQKKKRECGLWFLLRFVYLCPTAPHRNPEHWALSLCLDKSEFSECLTASRAVSQDGELVCLTVFLFSPCAPHTPSTPGWLPERAEPIRMSPEPVGLTWITDWARPLQQVGTVTHVHTHTCTCMAPSNMGTV